MSDAAEDIYFADGIAEDIITELSRYPDLFVAARNSSFTYRGKAVRVTDLARELGVQYVLEGSVRRAGSPHQRSAGRPMLLITGFRALGPSGLDPE